MPDSWTSDAIKLQEQSQYQNSAASTASSTTPSYCHSKTLKKCSLPIWPKDLRTTAQKFSNNAQKHHTGR